MQRSTAMTANTIDVIPIVPVTARPYAPASRDELPNITTMSTHATASSQFTCGR